MDGASGQPKLRSAPAGAAEADPASAVVPDLPWPLVADGHPSATWPWLSLGTPTSIDPGIPRGLTTNGRPTPWWVRGPRGAERLPDPGQHQQRGRIYHTPWGTDTTTARRSTSARASGRRSLPCCDPRECCDHFLVEKLACIDHQYCPSPETAWIGIDAGLSLTRHSLEAAASLSAGQRREVPRSPPRAVRAAPSPCSAP